MNVSLRELNPRCECCSFPIWPLYLLPCSFLVCADHFPTMNKNQGESCFKLELTKAYLSSLSLMFACVWTLDSQDSCWRGLRNCWVSTLKFIIEQCLAKPLPALLCCSPSVVNCWCLSHLGSNGNYVSPSNWRDMILSVLLLCTAPRVILRVNLFFGFNRVGFGPCGLTEGVGKKTLLVGNLVHALVIGPVWQTAINC